MDLIWHSFWDAEEMSVYQGWRVQIDVELILALSYQGLVLSCYVDDSNNLQAHHCHILYHEVEEPIITLKLVLTAFDSSD